MNKVILIGNIASDLEPRKVGEHTVVDFTIATNENVKRNGEWKEEATFHLIELWGAAADNLCKHMGKGSLISVEGKLSKDIWEDKDQQKRSKTYVKALRVEFLSSRKDKGPKPMKEGIGVEKSTNASPTNLGDGYDDIPF